jgi:DNA-directed RNA polymerase specialized sigma24 family protein
VSSENAPHRESDPRMRGSQNYKAGYAFEDRVAEAYRLLGYQVQHGRIFSGRQVDLFLELNLADLRVRRAVECKAGQVTVEDLDKFVSKLRLVQKEYPDASGAIVGGLGFTDAVTAHAKAVGIQLTLYRDLSAQILDGPSYAQRLVQEIEQNERYRPELFVEPLIGHEARGEGAKAFAVVKEWLTDSRWNQLTLLGDVGTGKSFLSRMIALQLAKEYLLQPMDSPLPLLFDLRNADREFSLEGLVLTHFAHHGLSRATFDIFQFLLSEGRIVLILDGFDEMASRVTPLITTRNFHELARSVKRNAKVLLTCRTHYFKSRTEEEEVVLGGSGPQSSDVARDLYWDLIARSGFRIEYLRPFSVSQVDEYVRRVCKEKADGVLAKINNIYNLTELSQRPLLLEMIVKSIDRFTTHEVNSAQLYEIFTGAWIHRDRWRDLMRSDDKLKFLTALARSLWEQEKTSIDGQKLQEYIGAELVSLIDSPQKLTELDGEIRTASFLVRDDRGQYGFAHSSYAEYFLARDLANRIATNDIKTLSIRRLTNEVIDFLLSMADKGILEQELTAILRDKYQPLLSENALLILYRLRRNLLIAEQGRGGDNIRLKIDMPSHVQLQGAKLAQINVEGAVLHSANLDSADLTQCIARGADFTSSSFRGVTARKGDFQEAVLSAANMTLAIFAEANFHGADVPLCEFSRADLSGSVFTVRDFSGAIIHETLLESAVLPPGKESQLLGGTEITEVQTSDQDREKTLLLASQIARKYAYLHGAGTDSTDIAADVVVFLLSHPKELARAHQTRAGLTAMVRNLTWRRIAELRRATPDQFGPMRRVDPDEVQSNEESDEQGPNPEELWQLQDEEIFALIERADISTGRSAEGLYEYSELLGILGKSINKNALQMLIARYVDEESVEEIAKIFRLSEIEVVRQLNKARELARNALGPH